VKVGRRQIEGIEILDLKGRLIAGTESGALRENVAALVAEGKSNLILNLKQLDFIDSTGLGTLVICFTALQQHGGALKLTNLAPRHIELLVLTKLTTVFELFDNERDAVNSFFPDRATKRFDILEYVRNQNP
jgi:anti-sigma B factor antagonist